MNLEKALALGGRIVAERKAKQNKQNTYVLHFTNDPSTVAGTMEGSTIKGLCDEFRSTHAQFTYAVVTKKGNDEKYLRYYNKNEGKKFISLVAKRGVSK